MYIEKADYKGRISMELLEQIVNTAGGEETVNLQYANKSAVDIITSYASTLYNPTDEFTKTGTNRNYQILNWGIDIALYLLYQKIADYEVPDKVIKNYDDTIGDLQKLSLGKIRVNLPANTGDGSQGNGLGDQGVGLRRIGSAPKRSHDI